MVKARSVAEALEQIRQGCTELHLGGACRGAALPTHRPRHRRTRMHACRRGGAACGAREPRAHAARALAAPTPRVRLATRAAEIEIGNEGAKELAAALKDNATLTTLDLRGARRGAALPTPTGSTAARVCTRAGGGRAARQPRAHAARALAAPTPRVRPPRVPQSIASAPRGPRSWPPRSRPTRPSPCLLYTSPSPRDRQKSRMPSSA